MINNERELFQGLKDLTLSEKARTHMRSELSAYADLHAVPEVASAPFNSVSFITGMFSASRPLMAGAFAIVFVISTTSATAFASEKALPGDVLYPIKVGVAEPVASVFAGTGIEKARFHAKLAVKRVEEAKMLEERGALTAEQEAELAERFIAETERVETLATEFETRDPGASIAIRSELAQELDVRVDDAPVADAAVAMVAESEPAVATRMMKVASAPAESEHEMSFKKIVSEKVAHLRSLQVDARVIAGGEAIRELEHEPKPAVASRGLLSGASVMRADEAASTSASSTPEDGTHFIRALIKAKQQKQEQEETDSQEQESSGPMKEAEGLIEKVADPVRLVPNILRD
jgi:hypothetical protein